MRIPLTAREQLERAHELGHDFRVETRGPWPEHGDLHPKYYLSCSCGWTPKNATRSRKAANTFMAWHMGKVIADGEDQGARVNGA